MPFNPTNVKVAVGTLWVAPLGTSEPTSVSGPWPSGWVEVGYTDQGSEFDFGPSVTPINVEEEYYPIRQAITSYSGKLTFVLAEATQQSLSIALNAGPTPVGTSLSGATQLAQEPVTPGSEVRVMLGWGAEYEGGTDVIPDAFQRYIWRQCLQIGQVKRTFRKGSVKASYSVEFALEKPTTGLQPWRSIIPNTLAS